MKRKQSVPLLDVIADCVAAMSMQLKREQEEWIIPADTALETWNAALAQAIQALDRHGVHANAAQRHAELAVTINSPTREERQEYTLSREYTLPALSASFIGELDRSIRVSPDGVAYYAPAERLSDDSFRF